MALMPEMLSAPPLELRRCQLEYIDALMRAIARSRRELARWLPWADPMPTIDAERRFIEDQQRAFDSDDDYGYFLIERPTGEIVGGAGLHRDEGGVAEIGYWVRSDRTSRGYATAAVDALTRAAFANLADVARIIIRMDQANLASAAVPPKLGYTLEGEDVSRDIATSGHTGKGWIWAQYRPT
jgi:RimJ/RimL family protein N-acetyltransferase